MSTLAPLDLAARLVTVAVMEPHEETRFQHPSLERDDQYACCFERRGVAIAFPQGYRPRVSVLFDDGTASTLPLEAVELEAVHDTAQYDLRQEAEAENAAFDDWKDGWDTPRETQAQRARRKVELRDRRTGAKPRRSFAYAH